MAITASDLATTGSNVDATSHATASITPSSNKLLLAWVYSIAAATPNTPTASGNSLTWVEVDNQLDSASLRKITLFRAMGASPSAGAVTFDFGGQTQTGAAWSIVEYTSADTSGTNGSGAIVQAVKNASAGNATSLTVTLAAFGSADNATAGGFGIPLNTASLPDVGAGFTATGQRNQSTPNLSIGSEFLASNDTSVDMTSGAGNIPWVGIAVELKLAVTNIDLVVNDLSTTPTLETPTLTQANALTVADIGTTPTLEAPALTQANSLTVADISATPTLDTPELTQANTLAVSDLSLTPTLETPTVALPTTDSPIIIPVTVAEEEPFSLTITQETPITITVAQTKSNLAVNIEDTIVTVTKSATINI